MTDAFDTNLEALRSYEAKLRAGAEELREAFTAVNGVDLTDLADGSAGTFTESAGFVAEYRSAAGQLWPSTVAVLRALEEAARALGDALDRYGEQERDSARLFEAIASQLRGDHL
ncbi:MAG TPA: hypothetical protein VHV49_01840 [Pseudonocardiaceae bacterium]|jgi:hypothetical protein|nr:hypothetical protein [Pseudonocardiaceae bacterium]